MVLAVHDASPYKSVADVIAAAKAQPGRLSVGTPGNGSINQIVLEWMALNTDTKFQHIPYKGGAPAPPRLPEATSRSGFWQARPWPRTSSPDASACWR